MRGLSLVMTSLLIPFLRMKYQFVITCTFGRIFEVIDLPDWLTVHIICDQLEVRRG